ncbi:hypothetical protein X943_001570 [Babesia divergens]|uniref:Uncharacterized protein n=1 Tax=Babesia divergens TaxID=32595 RepID=A0AAD9G726_BABDI|nr:hypothetical protein X943_001570 [Babesia divergens]
MSTLNVNDGFDGAVDNLLLSVDLENRGCQLVSPSRSLGSETDHKNVMTQLKSLLETSAVDTLDTTAGKKLPGEDVSSVIPPEFLELPLAGCKGALDHRQTRVSHLKQAKGNSPISSSMSVASDKSCVSPNRHDHASVLKHAEAVIEYQRERINSLEAAITKFNAAISKTNSLYKQEIQRYGDENLELRQKLQTLATEFEVLSKRYDLDLSDSEAMKRKLNLFNHDLAQRDTEIAQLNDRLHKLPVENEQLKEKIILMASEIERLNREIRGLNLLDVKVGAKAAPAEIALATKACAAQHDKLKASSKCIAQLEYDVQSYKRLTESQSMEIKRLNYKLEKLRSTNLPNQYMASAQKQMLQIRSLFTHLAKQVNEKRPEQPENTVDEDLKSRSLYAACNLKVSAEFREMYDKLLQVVDQNISRNTHTDGMFSTTINYSCKSINEELQIRVDESVLTFFRVDDDRLSEVIKIPLNSLLGVKRSAETNEFHIYTNDSADHVIRADTRDRFNRLNYALQYAGFITEDVRFSIFSKVDYNWIPANFSWPAFNAVVNAAESSFKSGAPDNLNDVRRVMSEVYVITEPTERMITIDTVTNSLIVLGPQMSSTPFVVPCDTAFAVRLCDPTHEQCSGFEAVEPPVTTLINGGPTGSYFMPSKHTFAFVLPSNRILFVNGVDSENEKRLLKIVSKGQYRISALIFEEPAEAIERIESYKSAPSLSPEAVAPPPMINQRESLEHMPTDPGSHKVYELVDNVLILYMNDEEPVRVLNTEGCFRVNEDKREVAISSGGNETYVLNFSSQDTLSNFVRDLEAHGFTVNVEVENHKQVCIVTAGCLQLFKDIRDEPIITFNNHDTNVSIKEDQREIQISQFKGKMVKMTLDCTSPAEFRRWKFALSFAGFIKSPMKTKPGHSLNKFIFPIKIFDEHQSNERRAFQVESNRICMYVNPTIQTPFLIFDKSNISLELYDVERRLRVYINRNLKMEERFDFVLAMLTDYESLKASLKTHQYATENSKKSKGPKYHFILSKPGMIAIHRTKYDAEPQLVLDRKCYTADVSDMRVHFMPKSGMDNSIVINFKKEFNFKRWIMALKVAGFLPLTNDRVPILYLPTIGYGHICPEIPTLLKGHLK